MKRLPLPIRHFPFSMRLRVEKHQLVVEPAPRVLYNSKSNQDDDSSVPSGKKLVGVEVKNLSMPFLAEYLKKHSLTRCSNFVDITCVDYPTRKNRFELVYILQSLQENTKITLKTLTNEISSVHSISSVFKGACWGEREVWDMFGVFFKDSPDLRRILTDYGFSGYPLRKEFPLSGYLEVFYNDKQKRVVTKKIEMTQEFRSFDLITPWRDKKAF